jgi:hypothetical protein
MNTKDPKLIALEFNEYINNRDLEKLANLMTDNHEFKDRVGNIYHSKSKMIEAWRNFFESNQNYKNIFLAIFSEDNIVKIIGYAYWSEENKHDPALWVVKIENDLVSEWNIYFDSEENRRLLGLHQITFYGSQIG